MAGGDNMIPVTESWNTIFSRAGLPFPGRIRPPCPFCESRTGFSVHEDKGFHCFACGIHGDKLSFIQQFHNCDFKGALRFFGLEPGRPPAPAPEQHQHQKIRFGLLEWAKETERQLRDHYYFRTRYEVHGKRRLTADPEDTIGWQMLALAYKEIPFEELDNWLDLLIGTDEQKLTAYLELNK